MPRSDDSLERLRAAIDELAAADAADVLAEARTEARARVRATLTDALAGAMLERLHEQLPGTQPDEPPPAARSREKRPGRRRGQAATAPREEQSAPASSAPASVPEQSAPDVSAPAPSAPAPPPAESSTETAWYVYGVVDSGNAPPPADLDDLGVQRSLADVTEGQLTAVVSRVPAEEFAEDELRAHLNDMAWVETVARAHERVLDALCRQTTVIPMRLCTVYKTEGGVREMLRRESDALLETLQNLEGKVEWGVKVFFHRRSASRRASGEEPSRESASGAEYMHHRRRERDRGRQLDEQIEAAVAEIHERLDSLSEESTLNPPQRPEVSAHPGEMVLNGAYLVQRENESAFHEEATELQSRFEGIGIELAVTGPWPAYNFLPSAIGAAW